jgi:hypothetical protein
MNGSRINCDLSVRLDLYLCMAIVFELSMHSIFAVLRVCSFHKLFNVTKLAYTYVKITGLTIANTQSGTLQSAADPDILGGDRAYIVRLGNGSDTPVMAVEPTDQPD